jgi:hypothetical protein
MLRDDEGGNKVTRMRIRSLGLNICEVQINTVDFRAQMYYHIYCTLIRRKKLFYCFVRSNANMRP